MELKMNKRDLARAIDAVSRLTGTFKLRSGKVSSEYFDKYLFESDPKLLSSIAGHLSAMIPRETEVLAGLEMGGIPVATALSVKTGLPLVLVRKKAKDYGTCKVVEGMDVRGRQVCMVEDVLTTGGQVLLSAEDLKRAGAAVRHVLCVIERDSAGKDNLARAGLELISLFTAADLAASRDT